MGREFYLWVSSPGEIFFCACVPVCWMLVVWGLLGQGVMTDVPVGFVDEDKSALSRETGRAIDANRSFGLITYENRHEAMKDLRKGTLYGVVAIPFGYSRDMLTGRGSSVILYADESRYAVAGTLQDEFNSVISALSGERIAQSAFHLGDGVEAAKRTLSVIHSDFYALGNMQFSFLAFLGASLMPGVIMVGAMLGFVTCILREDWHNNVPRWLNSANGSFSAALLGKLIPHHALYCLIFLFYIALFSGQGGFEAAGSLWIWFACGAACLAVFAAMAMLVTAIAPSWRVALVFASGYAAPALPFTGFSIPLESMGEGVRIFAQCLPLTWLIQGQAQQWTLGADLAHTGRVFMAFALLFAAPCLLGFPLFKRRYLKKAFAGDISES